MRKNIIEIKIIRNIAFIIDQYPIQGRHNDRIRRTNTIQ